MSPARSVTVQVPSPPLALEARLTSVPSAPLALIAPPHPVYGGTIGNPVVRALESVFGKAGLGTLAFNFRGTGESDGAPSGDQADALVDYLAAARSVPDATLAWLSGYSFGSIAALAAATELQVARVLMVAPPLAMLDPALLARFRGKLFVVVGDADEYAPLDALRERLTPPLDATGLEITTAVVDDAEHFFLGSAVQRLSSRLSQIVEEQTRHDA